MKARKAAAGLLAVSAVLGFLSGRLQGAYARATEEPPAVAISVQSVAVQQDGSFCAEVCLDKLPATGLSALEFAIAYDDAALRITKAELCYDTGAQRLETGAAPHSDLEVFTTDFREGFIQIRWGTMLLDPEYWLRETRPLLCLYGTATEALPKGGSCELQIVPANVIAADGTESAGKEITAGYLDENNQACRYGVTAANGTVRMPIDETGATMYGDVDFNGEITISDAILLMRVLAEETSLNAAAYANADCEADGMLTMADVTLMLQVLGHEREATALGAR